MKKALVFAFLVLLAMPSFAGDIWVYDANNNQIGILVGVSDSQVDVYIPSLSRTTSIITGSELQAGIDPSELGKINTGTTLYNDATCTGSSPGVSEPMEKIFQYGNNLFGYGQADTKTSNLITYSYRKYYWSGGSSCSGSPTTVIQGVPLIQVTLPFTTPISLPIKLQYIESAKGGGKPIK